MLVPKHRIIVTYLHNLFLKMFISAIKEEGRETELTILQQGCMAGLVFDLDR